MGLIGRRMDGGKYCAEFFQKLQRMLLDAVSNMLFCAFGWFFQLKVCIKSKKSIPDKTCTYIYVLFEKQLLQGEMKICQTRDLGMWMSLRIRQVVSNFQWVSFFFGKMIPNDCHWFLLICLGCPWFDIAKISTVFQ